MGGAIAARAAAENGVEVEGNEPGAGVERTQVEEIVVAIPAGEVGLAVVRKGVDREEAHPLPHVHRVGHGGHVIGFIGDRRGGGGPAGALGQGGGEADEVGPLVLGLVGVLEVVDLVEFRLAQGLARGRHHVSEVGGIHHGSTRRGAVQHPQGPVKVAPVVLGKMMGGEFRVQGLVAAIESVGGRPGSGRVGVVEADMHGAGLGHGQAGGAKEVAAHQLVGGVLGVQVEGRATVPGRGVGEGHGETLRLGLSAAVPAIAHGGRVGAFPASPVAGDPGGVEFGMAVGLVVDFARVEGKGRGAGVGVDVGQFGPIGGGENQAVERRVAGDHRAVHHVERVAKGVGDPGVVHRRCGPGSGGGAVRSGDVKLHHTSVRPGRQDGREQAVARHQVPPGAVIPHGLGGEGGGAVQPTGHGYADVGGFGVHDLARDGHRIGGSGHQGEVAGLGNERG